MKPPSLLPRRTTWPLLHSLLFYVPVTTISSEFLSSKPLSELQDEPMWLDLCGESVGPRRQSVYQLQVQTSSLFGLLVKLLEPISTINFGPLTFRTLFLRLFCLRTPL